MSESTRKMLYVDADACPVKEEIVDVCQRHQLRIVFVSSYAHDIHAPENVQVVTVDSDREAVDLYIVNNIKANDICVTQDHALASLLLMKNAIVLSPRGYLFKNEAIEPLLSSRHYAQKQRRMGNDVKGPKRFTTSDRLRFRRQLERCIGDLNKG